MRNDPTLKNQLAKLSQSLLRESVFMYIIATGDGCCISCPIKTNLMCLQHKKYFCSKCILFKWNEKNVRARFKLRLQVLRVLTLDNIILRANLT